MLVGALICNVAAFFVTTHTSPIEQIAQRTVQLREKTDEYRLIKPLLVCRQPESTLFDENVLLKKSIEDKIRAIKTQHKPLEASVYYRDLTSGRWIGVNEETVYTPASLLKIVILIAYLKESERDHMLLQTPVTFSQEQKALLDASPTDRGTELLIGNTYTIEELLQRMIARSDNGAAYALLQRFEPEKIKKVYQDLALADPDEAQDPFTMTVADYSFFLRVLYNATYLERNSSEKALTLLSQVEFRDGLSLSVPASIPVAHKYGEHLSPGITEKDPDVLELHDCGIIYHPDKPYLLCIMTRGEALKPLLETIQSISKIVFQDVSAKKE